MHNEEILENEYSISSKHRKVSAVNTGLPPGEKSSRLTALFRNLAPLNPRLLRYETNFEQYYHINPKALGVGIRTRKEVVTLTVLEVQQIIRALSSDSIHGLVARYLLKSDS